MLSLAVHGLHAVLVGQPVVPREPLRLASRACHLGHHVGLDKIVPEAVHGAAHGVTVLGVVLHPIARELAGIAEEHRHVCEWAPGDAHVVHDLCEVVGRYPL